jgi:YHS domain-containing protein
MNRIAILRRALFTMAILFGMAFSCVLLSSTYAEATTVTMEGELKPVVMNEVCMVTDKVFDKPQIPVEFEGRTYYGCCQGCVAKLKNNGALRSAIDPVNGHTIDKASATVIEGNGGEALYFESMETARKYFNR